MWVALAMVFTTMGLAQSPSPGQGRRQAWLAAAQHRSALRPDVTILDELGEPQQVARCGTRSPSALERQLSELQVRSWVRDNGLEHRAKKVTVPVYFHVTYRKKGGQDVGMISQSEIKDQINVANKAFKKHGFKFVLAGVDYTKNKKWFTRCHKNKFERRMKQALHVDTTKNLNVYTCRPGGFLGFAYFPDGSAGAWWDGITLLYSSLPGGSAVPYDGGDTFTHEAGHWAGLYHTFAPEPNGCKAPGDLIRDTPDEKKPDYACTQGRDTCATPGNDPIHNFMDYSDDDCLDHFTKGQAKRMKDQVATHRADL